MKSLKEEKICKEGIIESFKFSQNSTCSYDFRLIFPGTIPRADKIQGYSNTLTIQKNLFYPENLIKSK